MDLFLKDNSNINKNNKDNEKLFFKVFRNYFIFNEIFKHVRLYDLHESKAYSINLKDSKYKDYIKYIFDFNFTIKNQNILSNFKELIKLKFKKDFNKKLKVNSIPNTIKIIIFNKSYKQPIDLGILPTSLEYLSFHSFYNNSNFTITRNLLPNSITTLIFDNDEHNGYDAFRNDMGYFIDLNIEGILPNSLTKLNLPNNFNTKLTVKSLPNSITSLKFGLYNEPLEDNVLPDNLIELTMVCFNRDFNENTFTNCKQINKLILYNFNQKISGINLLPKSLTHLEFQFFNQPIMDTTNNSLLPNNLKYLDITYYNIDNNNNNNNGSLFFPNSIETLIINKINLFPLFPNSLTSLTMSYEIKGYIFKLLSRLKDINLNKCVFIKYKQYVYPNSNLVSLVFHPSKINEYENENENEEFFNQKNIKIIEIKQKNFIWSNLLEFRFLKELIFDKNSTFNENLIKGILPDSLERLEFGKHWNNGDNKNETNFYGKELEVGIFPNQIKFLKFGKLFYKSIKLEALPTSLIKLCLPKESLLLLPKNYILKFKISLFKKKNIY
ncbi:hypothetical protein ACTFIW_003009 [Dictyostelium discoideum]